MYHFTFISLFIFILFTGTISNISASDITPGMDIKVYWRTIRADKVSERDNNFEDYFMIKTQEGFSAERGIIRGEQIIEHFNNEHEDLNIANIMMLQVTKDRAPEKTTSKRLIDPRVNCNQYIVKHNDELCIFLDVEAMDEPLEAGEKIIVYTREVTAKNLYSAKIDDGQEPVKACEIEAGEGLYNSGSINARTILDCFSDNEELNAVRIYHPETSQERMGFLNAMRTGSASYDGFIVNTPEGKAVFADLIYIKN